MRATILWRAGIVAATMACLAAGCVGAPEGSGDGEVRAVRMRDGSVRVPFLGGAFATWNRDMPVDVEQAIAGEPTDHPVLVWAGD